MGKEPRQKDEIFNAAAEITDVDERASYIAEACGDDSALRAEIEDLLRHDDAVDSLLDRSAPGLGATLDQPITEKPGTQIGPYKLREKIGEGGMGEVYVAEQIKPVRRKVALKVIKPGMSTKHVVARFEAERQALALMDHPNIARVIDGGATESGQPFFVMELVQGLPITQYCDERRLNTDERLKLCANVCRAVQHAHQKGIIHRDLKPSNILIAEIDGEAVPKVIDFGIAKAVNQKLSDQTVYTQFSQMVGTPLYMSPEQAGLGVIDIDTRSDVYSLGVMLYELLTGATPFDSETLKRSGLDEMRRIIREEEPARPSRHVSTLSAQALSTVAERRASDPRKFSTSLRGELDWIVMKTLEKDRSRRYESASALAADVQRFLENEPVQACPPSVGYRVRKFARRNRRSLLAVTSVLVLGLIGLVSFVAHAWRQNERQRQFEFDAQRTLLTARTFIDRGNFSAAERQLAQLEGTLSNIDFRAPDLIASVRQMSDEIEGRTEAQRRFQQFEVLARDAMETMPRREDDDGSVWATQALGLYGILDDGDWLKDLQESTLPTEQQDIVRQTAYELLLELADAGVRWKNSRTEESAQESLGYLAIAEAYHERTRAFYWVRSQCHRFLEDDKAADEDLTRFENATASTAFDYFLPGHTASWRGQTDEAIRAYEAALQIQPDHYHSLFFLAMRLSEIGKKAEAAEVYRACLALRPDSVTSRVNRADDLRALGRLDDALELVNSAIELAGEDTSTNVFGCRAAIYLNQRNPKKALADLDRALKKEQGETNPDVMTLMSIYDHRGEAFHLMDQDDKALAELNHAAELMPANRTEEVCFHVFHNRGMLLSWGDEYAAALSDIEEALRIAEALGTRLPSHLVAHAHTTKGRILLNTGRQAEAILECDRAIQLGLKDKQETLCIRARALYETDQFDAALRDLNSLIDPSPDKLTPFSAWAHNYAAWILTLRPDVSPRDIPRAIELATKAVKYDSSNGDYLHTLGVAQYRAGDYASALNSLTTSLDSAETIKDHGFFLAMAYQHLGKVKQAQQWYERTAQWMTDNHSTDEELIRLRQEAERTLAIASEAKRLEDETPDAVRPDADGSAQPDSRIDREAR